MVAEDSRLHRLDMLKGLKALGSGTLATILLAVAGTLGLAYSWHLQNGELTRAVDEVSRLQLSQLVVDTDETQRDQWLIALDEELVKDKPSPTLLAAAAHHALECTLRRRSHMAERISNTSAEYGKAISDRETVITEADGLLKAEDYKSLIALLTHFTDADTSGGTAESDQKFFQAVDVANSRVSTLQRQVRISYLIGMALLLLSSIPGSISLEFTLRKVTRDSYPAKAPKRR